MANCIVEPLFLSIKVAAARYSVSVSTIKELLKYPDCPETKRLGTKVMIPTKEFDEFMLSVMT